MYPSNTTTETNPFPPSRPRLLGPQLTIKYSSTPVQEEWLSGNRTIYCNITCPQNPQHYPTHLTHVWRWVPNQLSAISRIHTIPSPKPKNGDLKTNSTTTDWKWTIIKIRYSLCLKKSVTIVHHLTFTYTLTHLSQPTCKFSSYTK